MKLHLDKDNFVELIEKLHRKYGYKMVVLEKDYYVTMLLKELSEKRGSEHAYFKGGTALYKALKAIRRYSEDVDLTIDVSDCVTPSQAKKRLEDSTLKFKSLPIGKKPDKRKGSVTCEYLYDTAFDNGTGEEYDRFGKIQVEATSFTISKPSEKMKVAPYLYELADEEGKRTLREKYDVGEFLVPTITLERIFLDKIFALEFYYQRNMLTDVAKHAYDLTVLSKTDRIKSFLSNLESLQEVMRYEREEALIRKGGLPNDLEVRDFSAFRELPSSLAFEGSFAKMQEKYVFEDSSYLELQDVFASLEWIRGKFL